MLALGTASRREDAPKEKVCQKREREVLGGTSDIKARGSSSTRGGLWGGKSKDQKNRPKEKRGGGDGPKSVIKTRKRIGNGHLVSERRGRKPIPNGWKEGNHWGKA